MDAKRDTPDARASRVAARQHGAVTRAQLEAAGLGSKAITIRVRKGQLHRVHRSVYTLGHRAPNLHARWMAAVLACGDGAVLSHSSAAALWGLLRPIDGPVHVSVPTAAGLMSRRGIRVHRCPSLAPEEPSSSPSSNCQGGGRRGQLTTIRERIPVTTIQRTIDDLDGTLPPHLVRRASRQAELKGVHLRGVERTRSRSDLEEDFLALCGRRHLPPPETNVKIGRWEVDFLWRDQRLVVETDSFTYHRGSVAFEDDHTRDLDLRSRGLGVLRFTDRQLENEPDRVAADVASELRR
jgi:very-short-patch-repair endonuclease